MPSEGEARSAVPLWSVGWQPGHLLQTWFSSLLIWSICVSGRPSRTGASIFFLCLRLFDLVPGHDGTDNDEERKDGGPAFPWEEEECDAGEGNESVLRDTSAAAGAERRWQ